MTGTEEGAMRVLAALLEARTGQQLAPNRRWRLEATLTPLMRAEGAETFAGLAARLATTRDPVLADKVVDALLNNETSFFRDPVAFRLLNEALVERLRALPSAQRRLRVWCVGCSTGQEAWSLAMMGEELAAALPGTRFDVLATDVSAAAIEQARAGLYTQFEVQRGLPARSLLRWFEQEGERWRVVRSLQRHVSFRRARLGQDSPAGLFDVILCRNVLLYFAADQRCRFLGLFADALAPGGRLMLGAGETVLGQSDRFAADPDYRGLYVAEAGEQRRQSI